MSGKSERPTVVLLGPSLRAVSGVSTHVNQLMASELARLYEIVHFQVGSEGRHESAFSTIWRLLASPFMLLRVLLRQDAKILHINTSLEPRSFWRDVTYLIVGKLCGLAVVYQVHGGALPAEFFSSSRVLSCFLRLVLRLPDEVVVLASVEVEAYKSFAKRKAPAFIPNAIELPSVTAGKRAADAEELQVAYVGRLADTKAVDDAIRAVRVAVDNGNKLRFTIAGSGEMEPQLRDQVRELGLDCHVRFCGAVFGEEKAEVWRNSGVFLFPTCHREGLPYALLEAMSFGVVPVTTAVGGIPDVVVNGHNGLLVPQRQSTDLVASLELLCRDRPMLARLAAAARKTIEDGYLVERLAREFDVVYRNVVRGT